MPRLLFLAVMLFLAACAFTRADDPAVSTATPPPMPQTTPVPTLNRELREVGTPLPGPSPEACQATAGRPMTRHTVQADIDYANRRILVRQKVDYINRTNIRLSQIVLNVKANAWPRVFSLDDVRAGDLRPAGVSLVGQRLAVALDPQLEPGCTLTIELDFGLAVPPIDPASPDSYRGYLGYSPRQFNLGHWLATVAPRSGDEWISHEDSPIGEQDVLDEADWEVTLTVTNAPESLQIAAPGMMESQAPGRWHFVLPNARDFSLSMSDRFQVTSAQAQNGVNVELYTFADARIETESGVIDGPAFTLDSAVKAVDAFSDLFGAYPGERLILVQADFPDGMEFSGIVFVGGEYFRAFNGPTSYLMIIAVHEISHQWWYSKVGSDQALYPWLDEALATYSEYVFVEQYYPALRDWWWNFRVDQLAPEGFVDSKVYEFSSRRAYINAVYLRGTRMLHDLRDDLGADAFFDWLRRYGEVGAGRLMTPEQLWLLLTPEQLEWTQATRERYLRQPELTRLQTGGS